MQKLSPRVCKKLDTRVLEGWENLGDCHSTGAFLAHQINASASRSPPLRSRTPIPGPLVKNSLLLPANKALSLSRTPGEACFLFPWLGLYSDLWLDFLKSYSKWTAMASARTWTDFFQYHVAQWLKGGISYQTAPSTYQVFCGLKGSRARAWIKPQNGSLNANMVRVFTISQVRNILSSFSELQFPPRWMGRAAQNYSLPRSTIRTVDVNQQLKASFGIVKNRMKLTRSQPCVWRRRQGQPQGPGQGRRWLFLELGGNQWDCLSMEMLSRWENPKWLRQLWGYVDGLCSV